MENNERVHHFRLVIPRDIKLRLAVAAAHEGSTQSALLLAILDEQLPHVAAAEPIVRAKGAQPSQRRGRAHVA